MSCQNFKGKGKDNFHERGGATFPLTPIHTTLYIHCYFSWHDTFTVIMNCGKDNFSRYIIFSQTLLSLPTLFQVTHLVIPRPANFRFLAGEYVNINIPEIAWAEWHPFTISSAPEQTGGWFVCLLVYLNITCQIFFSVVCFSLSREKSMFVIIIK